MGKSILDWTIKNPAEKSAGLRKYLDYFLASLLGVIDFPEGDDGGGVGAAPFLDEAGATAALFRGVDGDAGGVDVFSTFVGHTVSFAYLQSAQPPFHTQTTADLAHP
jgi:hypothetical protein